MIKKRIKELSRRLKGKLRSIALKRKLFEKRRGHKAEIRELLQTVKEKRRRLRLEREGLFCFKKTRWGGGTWIDGAIAQRSKKLKEIKRWIPQLIQQYNKAEQ